MLKIFLKFSFGSWVSAAISFFTIPIITLLINPEQFGKASMYILIYGIICQVIMLGNDQSFIRFFYEYKECDRSKLLWNAIFPSMFVCILVILSILFLWKYISTWLISEEDLLIVLLLSANFVFGLFNRYALLVVRMQQKAMLFSILQITTSIINALIIICYSKFIEGNFYAIICGMVTSLLFTTVIAIIVERKFWFQSFSVSKKRSKTLLKYGLPFLPTCLMAMFFEGMDKIFIREYIGFNELGLYSAAFKIVSVLSILQVGFSTFWTPKSYEHYEKNPNDKSLYERMFKYVLFILVLCGLSLILLKDVIALLFSASYREAGSIMPYLIFIPIMYILSEITQIGINFTKKTYYHIVIFGILLLICPVLNFILVPWLGVKGAALAVALSYTTFFFLRTIISTKLFSMSFNFLEIGLTLTLVYIVAGINTFVENYLLGLFSAIIAIAIYILLHISTLKELTGYVKHIFASKKTVS